MAADHGRAFHLGPGLMADQITLASSLCFRDATILRQPMRIAAAGRVQLPPEAPQCDQFIVRHRHHLHR